MLELEKPLNEKQVKCVARQMVEALEYLHNNKVMNRFMVFYRTPPFQDSCENVFLLP